jgi:hypothetical protein
MSLPQRGREVEDAVARRVIVGSAGPWTLYDESESGGIDRRQKPPVGHPWKPAIFLGPVNRVLRVQKQIIVRLSLRKTGGRLIRQARYFIPRLAESYLTQSLFGPILGRIERLAWHPT